LRTKATEFSFIFFSSSHLFFNMFPTYKVVNRCIIYVGAAPYCLLFIVKNVKFFRDMEFCYRFVPPISWIR
jgi:hypothetical protein